jgi:anti-sigma B factor antagonist
MSNASSIARSKPFATSSARDDRADRIRTKSERQLASASAAWNASRMDALGLVVSPDGEADTFVLSGELDLDTCSILLESFDLPSLAGRSIVFDLSGLTFIDSSGVQGLLMLLDAVGTGHLTLRAPPPNVRSSFQLVGLAEFANLPVE